VPKPLMPQGVEHLTNGITCDRESLQLTRVPTPLKSHQGWKLAEARAIAL
jgi:hypothetical protein